ncbi:MAG: YggS family pyridoxal phosphate-dependent enzyme [Bacillota bacterium]|nr:YggS family pyridoxal phosphate-dependent enzyme [Bacillota bacterium]
MSIAENIETVRQLMANAALRSGRKPEDVKLIAVSKTYPAEDILEATRCGITDIGENKVQEMCSKKPFLPPELNIHLIGHLQTNKVKQAVTNARMIHSVDSVHLAREISRVSILDGINTEVLIQVNVAHDEAKFGVEPNQLDDVLGEISTLENITVRGLMTVPAIETDINTTRRYFRALYNIFDKYKPLPYDNVKMECLSMGMSGDFEIAIEEGATMVRVGSKIFGTRNYNV